VRDPHPLLHLATPSCFPENKKEKEKIKKELTRKGHLKQKTLLCASVHHRRLLAFTHTLSLHTPPPLVSAHTTNIYHTREKDRSGQYM
jgi:hypothetical protein